MFPMKVLPTGFIDNLDVMQRASRPDGIHAARVIILVPRATVVRPHGALHVLLDVLVELVRHVLVGLKGTHELGLELG